LFLFFHSKIVMMVPRMQHVLVRVLLMSCVCCVVNAVISPEEVQQLLRERLVPVNMTLFQQAVDNHLMTLTHVTDGLTTTTTAVLVGAHQVSEVHFSRDLDWHAWLYVNLGIMLPPDLRTVTTTMRNMPLYANLTDPRVHRERPVVGSRTQYHMFHAVGFCLLPEDTLPVALQEFEERVRAALSDAVHQHAVGSESGGVQK
jgi:hypothetical protein